MRLYTFSLHFLQTAIHVSDDTLIHHQEHTQTVITTSGTGQTVLLLPVDEEELWLSSDSPHQRTVVNTVRPVPDVVNTVCMCSWWCMRVSYETCRAVCGKCNKTVYSHILLDNYWHWFTIHRPMNIKLLWGMIMNLMSYKSKLHSYGMSLCISYMKKVSHTAGVGENDDKWKDTD